ncbi:MAG TPA: ABC transporter permease [Xanthobacteraceae bacterium]|nr:ABC transporter permease [Xanthobacteraceae bacterium]
MSLAPKLAFRNLFHDRLRLIATVIGIVFSIVLVTVQMGLYVSFERMVTVMIDHADADLWIVPRGTKCFEDPSMLDERERFRALAVDGVASAVPLVIGFAQWRTPSGGNTPIFMIGSDPRGDGLAPWDVIEGTAQSLNNPGTVAIDRFYFDRLETTRVGDYAEIGDQRVQVTAITNGIRSFTTTPYVFASIDRARAYTSTAANKASYFLVRVTPGANLIQVRDRLRAQMPDTEVLTTAEFRERSADFWLFGTGAGAALFAGAVLGLIVGTVIVAQTLYSSTKDHLNEFATLRAIGSSGRYIHKVIIFQALLSALIGFCLAATIGWIVVLATADTALPVVITPLMTVALLVLTVLMCVISAIAAIMKVTRIDPAMVFTR